jgi:hypothetical protein
LTRTRPIWEFLWQSICTYITEVTVNSTTLQRTAVASEHEGATREPPDAGVKITNRLSRRLTLVPHGALSSMSLKSQGRGVICMGIAMSVLNDTMDQCHLLAGASTSCSFVGTRPSRVLLSSFQCWLCFKAYEFQWPGQRSGSRCRIGGHTAAPLMQRLCPGPRLLATLNASRQLDTGHYSKLLHSQLFGEPVLE